MSVIVVVVRVHVPFSSKVFDAMARRVGCWCQCLKEHRESLQWHFLPPSLLLRWLQFLLLFTLRHACIVVSWGISDLYKVVGEYDRIE
jgi:hypothetical protein